MLATATHDHKRGEAVRARLAVLSEIPDEWERTVRQWFAMNEPHRRRGNGPMPSPGDELMLYQMIIGAWPIDDVDLRDFTERLAGWQLKALREAKLATDWQAPGTWSTRTRRGRSSEARSWRIAGFADDAARARAAASSRPAR